MLLRLLIIGPKAIRIKLYRLVPDPTKCNTPFRLSATLRRWDHDDEAFFPGGGLESIVERDQRQ
jgi:hypothetical protein